MRRDHLEELISETGGLMEALAAAQESCDAPWVIGTGCIRDLVWNDIDPASA